MSLVFCTSKVKRGIEGQESFYQLGESFGHEQMLHQADQNIRTKKLSYLIFSSSSEGTFCSSEDKFRAHLDLRRRIQRIPKSIIGQTDMKLKHK